MTPQQCRMARAALNWSRLDLANEAPCALRTVFAFETGHTIRDASAKRIKAALEREGVEFIKSGVKLMQKAS